MSTFRYDLIVDWGDDGCTAYLEDRDSPIRGYGVTPIEALAALAECLREWPNGGAQRWLWTPAGVKLARMFVPGYGSGSGRQGGAS